MPGSVGLPRGVLDLIKENWEEGPSPSKSEIQYVMDLRAKLHTLGQLSRENLLEAQERQQRLYNRGTKRRQFSPGDKVLVLLLTSSTKLLAKWQGPFVVTRRVGEVDYEVQRTDREGAKQIYHLNLLKVWKEVVAVSLVTVDQERDELGIGGNPFKQSVGTPFRWPPLTEPKIRPRRVAKAFCGCVLSPTRSHVPHTPPCRNNPGCVGSDKTISTA